jgi:hypothetical protein
VEANSLSLMLADLLARTTTELARVELTLPDRQYYTVGGAVYDCPQVVVSADLIQPGIANAQDTGIPLLVGPCEVVWRANLTIAYVWTAAEAPTGPRSTGVPRASDVMLDADRVGTAVAGLSRMVESITNDDHYGSLTASLALGQPQGGLIAVEAQITTNIWW